MKQAQALHLMKQGNSVFLTGAAGSGKTYVLNRFIDHLKKQGKQVAVTASTGIAATHIGGTTIHSWSGLGIRDSLAPQDKAWLAGNDRLSKRYNSCDVLIIDEVSMLHGSRLDMINEACKLLRKNDEPFGGLQVVLTGDLFQLPPVNRAGGPDDFSHTSAAWQELNPKICYLQEQHRQRGDELLDILEAMRRGTADENHQQLLMQRVGIEPPPEAVFTRLYTHNVDVEAINDRQLQTLPGETETFQMITSGSARYVEQLQKSVLAPLVLELKKGAEVMFVANNFAQGFVNGSRGRVVEFKEDVPVVQLQSTGRRITVEPHAWTFVEDGRERARVMQLPLRLAWAITIHKSQGMSMDGALIDLSRSFTYGMGYVALSRVRSLDGLYLAGLNRLALQLHPEIYTFDAALREASDQLAEQIGAIVELSEEPAESEQAPAPHPALRQALTAWRTAQASAKAVPAFMIAHNRTLDAIATRQPRTPSQLLAVHGVGRKFVDTYGEEILALVQSHQSGDNPPPPIDTKPILQYIEDQGIALSPEKRDAILRALQDD